MTSEATTTTGFYHYNYETSEVFSALKRVSEEINRNWSTEQYLNALDTMLMHALEAVIRSSDFLDHIIAGVLAWHHEVPSNHKISAFDRHEACHYLMAFLMATSPDEKLKVLKRLKLDRNITLLALDKWLKLTQDYRRLEEKVASSRQLTSGSLRKMRQVEQVVIHGKAHSSLYAAIASAAYWTDQALRLRQKILEKYYRLVLNEARLFYAEMHHSILLNDTIQAMLIEAMKALDKCNQEKGTITSYMQLWVRRSRGKVGAEMDTAFSVPGSARKGDYSYKSLDLQGMGDNIHVSHDPEDSRITAMHVRRLARIFDPSGLGRVALGIEEYAPALKSLCPKG